MHHQIGVVIASGLLLAGTALPAWGGTTERISVGMGGVQADRGGFFSGLSADGRFVVFGSGATNLVPGDSNGKFDVFVRDRQAGTTERVSVGSGGIQGNEVSTEPAISADGRFVSFFSSATNLVSGDTNGVDDVFVHDRTTNVTRRVSVGPGGIEANGPSSEARLSGDGRLVVFESDASNLVTGDTNGARDSFVHDLATGRTRRLSFEPGGAQPPSGSGLADISADGRLVVFGLGDLFIQNLVTGATRRVFDSPGLIAFAARLSPFGRFLVFTSPDRLSPGDRNSEEDVFVRDLETGVTRLASFAVNGGQSNGDSSFTAISGRGRFVAFDSFATNLVPRDTNGEGDVFVRDRRLHTTRRVSAGPSGLEANGTSQLPEISANGNVVAFQSGATNLVPGDTNGITDVFVHVLGP